MKRQEVNDKKFIFPYVEYSPSDKKEGLPLIIQLHGSGERGSGNEDLSKVDIHGFSKYLLNVEEDCIVVMPQCPEDTFWVARVESIVEFVEQMIEEYKADAKRVYLTGLSMGGYGTWFTAMARPDLFAAIAPVCGGGMAWNAKVLDMPIWVFHGGLDNVVSPIQSDEMVLALKTCGKDVTYSRIETEGHGVWVKAYTEELFKWLLDKRKK